MTLLDDSRTAPREDWRRFHRGATPYCDIEIHSGYARLNGHRTVIDCARHLHGRDGLAIADSALRAEITAHDALLEVRRRQRRWTSATRATSVLLLADGRRENWLESASAWAIKAWDLPDPVPQVEILSPEGEFVARVDNLWPDHGVVGEADGVSKYLLDGTTDEAVTQAQ